MKVICYETVCLCFLVLVFSASSHAWSNGQDASQVMGQADFTSNISGISVRDFREPSDVAIDLVNGKIYVCDEENNRVLRFSYPVTANYPDAELVFGQGFFTSSSRGTSQKTFDDPRGIAVDSSGRLWVADTDNHRVVWFDNAHTLTINQPDADGVLGQTGFINGTGTGATAQNRMRLPYDITFDANGRLFVADSGNHRILRFDKGAGVEDGDDADGVLGQSDFSSGNSATAQNRMDSPRGVAILGTSLFVADRDNARVLRFDDAASKADGADADVVLGNSDFTTIQTGTTQSITGFVGRVAVDGTGRLYVSDSGVNDRILIYNNALVKTNGANADNVIGQPDFTSSGFDVAKDRLNMLTPGGGMATDTLNNILAVSDDNNDRVLLFQDTASGPRMNVRIGVTYIPDGGTFDFGSFSTGIDVDVTVIIENSGSQTLELTGSPIAVITGDDASQFSIETQPASSIAIGSSTTFTVRFSPTSTGIRRAEVVIETNDPDNTPYNLIVTGDDGNGLTVKVTGSCFISSVK